MENITVFIAFIAGIVSFLSPCVLPLVPGYINILTEGSEDPKKDIILKKSLLFILGFTIVFIAMGASATMFGRIFNENIKIFRIISGSIIIVFGLHTLEILKLKMLYKEKRLLGRVNNLGPVLMGMAFGGGWTPCIGPILASILLYASTSEGAFQGAVMLSFYSIGLGVPFLITAMLIERFNIFKGKLYKYMDLIKKVTGIIMVIVGVLVITNKLVVIIGLLT